MYDPREVLEICEKATPGPWYGLENSGVYTDPEHENPIFETGCGCCTSKALKTEDAYLIALARAALPELAQRVVDLEKQLESLTPGGSEFYNDPERCIQWVKDRLATVSKQVKERKEAEAENAKLRATIAAMQDALEEVKARCELRRQDDDAHYENYYEAKQALAAAGYGGEE